VTDWRGVVGAVDRAYSAVRDRGQRVEPTRWQSTDVSKRLEATTYEVLNHTVQFAVPGEDVTELAGAVGPNLPWADDHFAERVSELPLNPGVEWARWPWGNSANSFRRDAVVGPGARVLADGSYDQGFSHTYMERMWPKHANRAVTDDGTPCGVEFPDGERRRLSVVESTHRGVRYLYGDAGDVVDHLAKHPDSRQAFLPIWFPEDTGKTDVRVPCTLGYHFIHRRGHLHCTYYIRSCDLYRHFRDDVYLTVRLQLWMLDQLRERDCVGDEFWCHVRPGIFTMHVVSLHAFVNDCTVMWPGWRPRP